MMLISNMTSISEDSQDQDDQDMDVALPINRSLLYQSPLHSLKQPSRSFFAQSETAKLYVLGFATAAAQVKPDSLIFTVRDISRIEDLRSVIDSLSKLWNERSGQGACGY